VPSEEIAPENSLKSFYLAVKSGFAIEIDIQVSKDLEILVFHDDKLERLTNKTGFICQRKISYLKTATLRNGEKIPSLDKVLSFINGRVPVLIEIKTSETLRENQEKFFESIKEKTLNYEGEIGFMSFDLDIIKSLKKIGLDKRILVGLIKDFSRLEKKEFDLDYKQTIRQIKNLKLDFISQNWTSLNSDRSLQIKNLGTIIMCWTVTSENIALSVKKLADNITFEGYKPNMF
jgi:glycerophosphoryl diester phosphodiesterase